MKDFPIIKLTIFFITGIILHSVFPLSLKLNLFFLGISVILLLIIFFIERNRSLKSGSSIFLPIIISLCGFTSGNIQQKDRIFLPDSLQVIKDFRAYGKVENIDLPDDDGFSFLLKTDSIRASKTLKTQINLICKVYDKKFHILLNKMVPGSSISITGTYRKGRETCNPGEFDYNKYLHSLNISGIINSYNSEDIKILVSGYYSFDGMIYSIRNNFDSVISSLHTTETKALLRGLLLADRTDIDFETKTQFINAGVMHILAVSGLHVVFIAMIFYTLFGRLNQYLKAVLTIIGILIFTFLTGVSASVFRASIMAIVVIIAFLSNRTTNIYNSLAISALIILWADPSELFNPGFQLSFSAVFSIAYFYPIIRRQILKTCISSKVLNSILLFTSVSLSAQIGTLPFTLYYFGKLSLVSIFANMLVIPLSGFIIGDGIITLAIYSFSSWAASVFASANDLLSNLLLLIVKFAGSMQYAFADVKNFSLLDAVMFYLMVFSGIFFIRHLSTLKSKMIAMILVIANIWIYTSLDDIDLLDDKLNVYMTDVGQGDAFLIKFPGGKTALIDCGNATPLYDNGERVILPLLHIWEIKKIDYGFVSHIDADHYRGFISVIEKCGINKIFKPALLKQSDKDLRFEKYLKSKHIPVEYYTKKKIRINKAVIYILNDPLYDSDSSVSSNNRSGLLKLAYGKTSFLFTGDMEKSGERYYSEYYDSFLDSDVLKIGHHGSKSGSSKEFITLVSPKMSLISCGVKNSFNHPSREVVSRVKESGSVIYRTDMQGGILLQSDGYTINKVEWK